MEMEFDLFKSEYPSSHSFIALPIKKEHLNVYEQIYENIVALHPCSFNTHVLLTLF